MTATHRTVRGMDKNTPTDLDLIAEGENALEMLAKAAGGKLDKDFAGYDAAKEADTSSDEGSEDAGEDQDEDSGDADPTASSDGEDADEDDKDDDETMAKGADLYDAAPLIKAVGQELTENRKELAENRKELTATRELLVKAIGIIEEQGLMLRAQNAGVAQIIKAQNSLLGQPLIAKADSAKATVTARVPVRDAAPVSSSAALFRKATDSPSISPFRMRQVEEAFNAGTDLNTVLSSNEIAILNKGEAQ